MSDVDRALEFAQNAHEGQMYGDEPYIHHPIQVARRLAADDEVGRVVAFLHDTVEDCGVDPREIEAEFGLEVREAVEAITRHAGEMYFDYIERLSKNPIAKRVKIADLLENLSQGDVSLSKRYYKALKMLS